jgi:catechol 2,3-dioxygenase-like lactoylglutathione lyase family enzyme
MHWCRVQIPEVAVGRSRLAAMTASIRVLGLDHIVLVTPDVRRALTFYTARLGLPGVRVEEWSRGEAPFPSVRLDATTLIDLMSGERSGTNLHHFCLVIEATDLDVLAASGVWDVVSGPTAGLFGARGYARSMYVRDPDGNVIELRSY